MTRIGLTNTHAAVRAVAFHNPDGRIAVVAQNETGDSHSMTLGCHSMTLDSHSMTLGCRGMVLAKELPAYSIAAFVLAD